MHSGSVDGELLVAVPPTVGAIEVASADCRLYLSGLLFHPGDGRFDDAWKITFLDAAPAAVARVDGFHLFPDSLAYPLTESVLPREQNLVLRPVPGMRS